MNVEYAALSIFILGLTWFISKSLILVGRKFFTTFVRKTNIKQQQQIKLN